MYQCLFFSTRTPLSAKKFFAYNSILLRKKERTIDAMKPEMKSLCMNKIQSFADISEITSELLPMSSRRLVTG